jgi:hypothetical protein
LGLRAGALLVREWNGKLERVMILEEGFAWNGQTFGSLSQIAKAMTGTNWNGHRFFGLRHHEARCWVVIRGSYRELGRQRAWGKLPTAAARARG